MEKQQAGWASHAAAFLLAGVIETNVDLAEKTNEGVTEYWNKRYHDAISFAEKAVEFNPSIKAPVDMLLFHIKAEVEEYHPDVKKRIDTLLLEPNIEMFKHYQRNPVQALLQYKGNLFGMKFSEKSEEFNSHANNQNDEEYFISLLNRLD